MGEIVCRFTVSNFDFSSMPIAVLEESDIPMTTTLSFSAGHTFLKARDILEIVVEFGGIPTL